MVGRLGMRGQVAVYSGRDDELDRTLVDGESPGRGNVVGLLTGGAPGELSGGQTALVGRGSPESLVCTLEGKGAAGVQCGAFAPGGRLLATGTAEGANSLGRGLEAEKAKRR